ncbi:hypothetical protein [Streptomyces lydicus]|uniref:hypothetical protein n=1 Tax=Streptomyces lydicus TaxID=47763 RepID=UPI0037A619D7
MERVLKDFPAPVFSTCCVQTGPFFVAGRLLAVAHAVEQTFPCAGHVVPSSLGSVMFTFAAQLPVTVRE